MTEALRRWLSFGLLLLLLICGTPFSRAEIANTTAAFGLSATFTCDEQATIAYDGRSLSAFDYDPVVVPTADRDATSTAAASRIIGKSAEFLAAESTATFGRAASTDYRATFFAANPELEGQVVVHHAVEQQTLKLYPSQVTEAEIHSLENLRGIPKDINSQVHLSQIRKEWNQFYLANPNATQAQLLQKAAEIDAKFGSQFRPPVGGGQ